MNSGRISLYSCHAFSRAYAHGPRMSKRQGRSTSGYRYRGSHSLLAFTFWPLTAHLYRGRLGEGGWAGGMLCYARRCRALAEARFCCAELTSFFVLTEHGARDGGLGRTQGIG